MILTIDVGNTNIVLGGFENDELKFVSRLQTNKYKMPDEYAVDFKALLEFGGYNAQMFDGAIVSSVVPPLLPTIKKAVMRLINKKVLTVSPGTKTGLHIKIDNPGILGADLVCSAVAALARYKLPCIIVDLGTATKFSVIDKSGEFLGVSILPGVQISLEALSKSTAQLPHIEFDGAQNVIGTNTTDSMKSGIAFGTASMLDGMISRINEEIGDIATVVVTGGIAENITPYCKCEMVIDENLILYGLHDVYLKNTKGAQRA